MALLEFCSALLVRKFEENFIIVRYHFKMGHNGHIPVEQTYAGKGLELANNLPFGLPVQLIIDPDPLQKAILYPYQPVLKDKCESSSVDEESNDNSNDNKNVNNNSDGKSDNGNVENGE